MRAVTRFQLISIVLSFILVSVGVYIACKSPEEFPRDVRFEVQEGESLERVSSRLKEANLIKSSLLFRTWISVLGKDDKVSLGVYEFSEPVSLGGVVGKFSNGPDAPLISVTIPEGFSVSDTAQAFEKVLSNFSAQEFINEVNKRELEGYLFPSTYFPLPSDSERDIISRMNALFEREYAKFFNHLAYPATVTSKRAVISLAAILEGEAKTEEDMKIISGILQKRLSMGMRLQVDVVPDTYKQAGIPAVPINNPGHIAIDAVFNPIPSKYLYYITGRDGTMYYATTFQEHKRNIEKYLR